MAGRTHRRMRRCRRSCSPPITSTAPILEARGIVKSFGGIKAVQGVDIAVRDRTLHALIGPNGAGKTTAFNLISGMFPPDEGDDRCSRASRSPALRRRTSPRAGIGRSFQITNLFPALCGRGEHAARRAGAPPRSASIRWTHARVDRRRSTPKPRR